MTRHEHRTHNVGMIGTPDTAASAGSWEDEEEWWRNNYTKRRYVERERGFDYYRPGFRYGFESAQRYPDRQWTDVEAELRSGWEGQENRGASAWEEIKETVRDAWEHLKGGEHAEHERRERL